MKRYFTIFLLLICYSSFAQKSFVKGYYLTQQHDTVHCYINDRNWSKNPTSIVVATLPDGSNRKEMALTDMQGFYLSTGDLYERHIVTIDKSPFHKITLQVNALPVIVTDTVFLKALVKGAMNLYYLKDENMKEHFYLQRNGEQPQELISRAVKVEVNNQTLFGKEDLYKDLLASYMTGCSEVEKKIPTVWFGERHLKKLVQAYNKCKTGSEAYYIAPDAGMKAQLAVTAGGFPAKLEFNGKGQPALSNTNFKGTGYAAGMAINILMPRLHSRWSIYNELLWKSYQVKGDYEHRLSASNYTTSQYELKMSGLGLNTMIRFQLPMKTVQPYINVGVANNYYFNVINEQKKKRYLYSDYREQDVKVLDEIRKYEQALIAGVGANYKNFQLEFRYDRGNGMSAYSLLKSSKTMYGFTVGYYLKK